MEKRINKNSRSKTGEIIRVAGDRLVAGIPPVRVRHGVGVDIPAIVLDVPVRVHGPESLCTENHPYHCP